MREFNAAEYVRYLGLRWRVPALAVGIAVVLTLIASLLLPRRYTATATLLIDAPAGSDPRSAGAVSPIYLESLKSYEQFALSDSLFQRAAIRFQLVAPGGAVDSLKRRVLKVTKPRDTRILEVSTTLGDPVKAQALAQYIAEQTVDLNQSLARQSDQDVLQDATRQLDTTSRRVAAAEAAWSSEMTREPIEGLQADLESTVELLARLRRDAREADADVADLTAQVAASAPSGDDSGSRARRELAAARARASTLDTQIRDLEARVGTDEARLGDRRGRQAPLQTERQAAHTAYEAAAARLNEVRASTGLRGERLKIVDAGIVPQRPSSPNIPLNVVAAFLLAMVGSVVYLSLAFSYRREREVEKLRYAYRESR